MVKFVGRTVPSFRIALESEIKDWNKFKKNFHGGNLNSLHDIFNISRCYVSASSSAVRLFKFEGLLMPVLLEHYKMLEDIGSKIEERRLEEKKDVD